jgi:hypothetical protein
MGKLYLSFEIPQMIAIQDLRFSSGGYGEFLSSAI